MLHLKKQKPKKTNKGALTPTSKLTGILFLSWRWHINVEKYVDYWKDTAAVAVFEQLKMK